MVDWMIEVLTNFKCDDQTYFIAVAIMDRFFKLKKDTLEVANLHVVGVAAMFLASKYEDIYPLKMGVVFEKIAHKKLPIRDIKAQEREILQLLGFNLSIPTQLDFLRYYEHELFRNERDAPNMQLILKMSLYLAKMSMHDYELAGQAPSLLATGALYVSLKICEQLKKTQLIHPGLVPKIVALSECAEDAVIDIS